VGELRENHDIEIVNRSTGNAAQLKYFETTVTNENSVHEETKKMLNLGNARYHLVPNHLSSRLLPKNIKILILVYNTIILPVVLYGYKTWSVELRGQHRLRVFENGC
jgi:hypothetical protein